MQRVASVKGQEITAYKLSKVKFKADPQKDLAVLSDFKFELTSENMDKFEDTFGITLVDDPELRTKYSHSGHLYVAKVELLARRGVPENCCYGLFAIEGARNPSIQAECYVIFYLGKDVINQQVKDTSYVFNLPATDKYPAARIDAREAGNAGRFANTSRYPNMNIVRNKGNVCFAATCAIGNSQLVINYGKKYELKNEIPVQAHHDWQTSQQDFEGRLANYTLTKVSDPILDEVKRLIPRPDGDLLFIPSAVCMKEAKNPDVNAIVYVGYLHEGKPVVRREQIELNPLMISCLCGDYENAKQLLQQGADPVRYTLDTFSTPLHFVFKNKNLPIGQKVKFIELLVQEGRAPTEIEDKDNLSPLHYYIRDFTGNLFNYKMLEMMFRNFRPEFKEFKFPLINYAMDQNNPAALLALINLFKSDLAEELFEKKEGAYALNAQGERLKALLQKLPKESNEFHDKLCNRLVNNLRDEARLPTHVCAQLVPAKFLNRVDWSLQTAGTMSQEKRKVKVTARRKKFEESKSVKKSSTKDVVKKLEDTKRVPIPKRKFDQSPDLVDEALQPAKKKVKREPFVPEVKSTPANSGHGRPNITIKKCKPSLPSQTTFLKQKRKLSADETPSKRQKTHGSPKPMSGTGPGSKK